MKINTSPKPTNAQLLNATYSCELSGWELATMAILARGCAAGSPVSSLRMFSDSFYKEVERAFPSFTIDSLEVSEGPVDTLYFGEHSLDTLINHK